MKPMKRKPAPMLEGEPSPSLARIRTMNMQDLALRVVRLTNEIASLKKRLGHLEAHKPAPPPERLAALRKQIDRLLVLEKLAREQLMTKGVRKKQYEQREQGFRPGPRPGPGPGSAPGSAPRPAPGPGTPPPPRPPGSV